MKFGIVVFPGTWSERDWYYAVNRIPGQEVNYIWHKDTELNSYDCLILPGGFSYGDYLRPGAIARFSPVMAAVEHFAKQGAWLLVAVMAFRFSAKPGSCLAC